MAKLSPQGPFRAFDFNGEPLAGGLLYTYEASTSTPKVTYTNEGAGTPNTNPVVLDANGYANVWLGDGAYKLVLKDSASVVQWSIDDVVGDASQGFAAAVIDQGTNLIISEAYAGYVINATAAITLSLLGASAAGQGFYFSVKASGGAVVIDPDGAELIDGASSLTIPQGFSALIVCNGTVWYSLFLQKTTTGPLTVTGTVTINGTSANSGAVILGEDTDNGSNTTTIRGASAMAADRVILTPDLDGTLALTTQTTGRLLNVQTITATGTYTPTAGTNAARVIAIGGGGGGGGKNSQAQEGCGGGGGGEMRQLFISSGVVSGSVTIGAAGAAGTTSGTAGGAGGNTSFAALLTANGGSGGAGITAAAGAASGGAGGSGGSGGTAFGATPGLPGVRSGAGTGLGGNGASTSYGGGGVGGFNNTTGQAGAAGTGFGAGGGGGGSTAATAFAGGAGTAGVIIIYEFS